MGFVFGIMGLFWNGGCYAGECRSALSGVRGGEFVKLSGVLREGKYDDGGGFRHQVEGCRVRQVRVGDGRLFGGGAGVQMEPAVWLGGAGEADARDGSQLHAVEALDGGSCRCRRVGGEESRVR